MYNTRRQARGRCELIRSDPGTHLCYHTHPHCYCGTRANLTHHFLCHEEAHPCFYWPCKLLGIPWDVNKNFLSSQPSCLQVLRLYISIHTLRADLLVPFLEFTSFATLYLDSYFESWPTCPFFRIYKFCNFISRFILWELIYLSLF